MAITDRDETGHAGSHRASRLERMLETQYEARHELVEEEVAEHLLSLDDKVLADHGLDPAVLRSGRVH